MGATFLMSYPPARWTIRGGANFRSKARAATHPRAAMHEWLALCDAITRHGGRILVMPAGDADPPLTGMVYTANAGAMFKVGDRWTWMLPNVAVEHRRDEKERIAAFWAEAGVATDDCPHAWEGQADIATLPGNRFILTWGVRSARESLDDVRRRLPPGARTLEVQLREPWFHGDTCLDAMQTPGRDTVLLAFAGALVDRTIAELRTFCTAEVEVIPIDEADCLGYAANSLCVNGAALTPSGLSTGLRGQLARRGFTIEELELPELFGKGGGGPRCLVNELRGFVLTEEAPDYVSQRDRLHQLAERYPESSDH
jgi:N-dimethylarginine dimethylaminohydrolase